MTQNTMPPLFVVSQIKSRSQTGKLQGQQGKGDDLTNPLQTIHCNEQAVLGEVDQ